MYERKYVIPEKFGAAWDCDRMSLYKAINKEKSDFIQKVADFYLLMEAYYIAKSVEENNNYFPQEYFLMPEKHRINVINLYPEVVYDMAKDIYYRARYSIGSECRHCVFESNLNKYLYILPRIRFPKYSIEYLARKYFFVRRSKNSNYTLKGKISEKSRKRGYNYFKRIENETEIQIEDIGILIFGELEWPDAGFGGDSWLKISEATKELGEAKDTREKELCIDKLIDMQHNNGFGINKTFAESEEYDYTSGLLKIFLDLKAEGDIMGFRPFISKKYMTIYGILCNIRRKMCD